MNSFCNLLRIAILYILLFYFIFGNHIRTFSQRQLFGAISDFSLTDFKFNLFYNPIYSPRRNFDKFATKKKVMILFGTRPEAIKLAPLINRMKLIPPFQVITVSTGQHSSMLSQALTAFNISPQIHLDVMTPNQTLTGLTSKLLIRLDSLCLELQPDLIIVQGDTTSAFVGSLVAFYHHIDVAHVEAGLRTFNINSPFPEEFNRKSISLVAKYNFAATNLAKHNLISEGVAENSIFVTGNTVVDSLLYVLNSTKPSIELTRLFSFFPKQISNPIKVLLTTHRRENHGAPMENIFHSIFELLKKCSNLSYSIQCTKIQPLKQLLLSHCLILIFLIQFHSIFLSWKQNILI